MAELVVRFDREDRAGVSGTVRTVGEPGDVRRFAGWLQLLGLLEAAVDANPDHQYATGKPPA